MNTAQKVIAIFKYLNGLKQSCTIGNVNIYVYNNGTTDEFNLTINGNRIGGTNSNLITDINEISTDSITCFLSSTYNPTGVSIDNQEFSTELSEEELFQYSLQYPEFDELRNLREHKEFLLLKEYVNEVYSELKL